MEGTNKEKNYFADSFFKTPNKCSSIKRDFSELIQQFFFNLQFFFIHNGKPKITNSAVIHKHSSIL